MALGKSGVLDGNKRPSAQEIGEIVRKFGIAGIRTAPQEIESVGEHPILTPYLYEILKQPQSLPFLEFAARPYEADKKELTKFFIPPMFRFRDGSAFVNPMLPDLLRLPGEMPDEDRRRKNVQSLIFTISISGAVLRIACAEIDLVVPAIKPTEIAGKVDKEEPLARVINPAVAGLIEKVDIINKAQSAEGRKKLFVHLAGLLLSDSVEYLVKKTEVAKLLKWDEQRVHSAVIKLREHGTGGGLVFEGALPKKIWSNVEYGIAGLGLECSYNSFLERPLVFDPTTNETVILNDTLCRMLRDRIHESFSGLDGKDLIPDVLYAMALREQFNPIIDYLNGLTWDGQPRIDTWLSNAFTGPADTPLLRAVGRKFLCAMVRRARVPGCKFDHVMVIEGVQDIGKSLALKVLIGGIPGGVEDYFSDQPVLGLDKDQPIQEALRGRWLYELAELDGIRKSDVERVKAFITRQVDRGRRVYDRFPSDPARTCVFVGTTNEQNYLQDTTGNRRWWPVGYCTAVDLAWIAANRDQLFAEAVLVEPTEQLWLPESLRADARAVQDSRRSTHPWEELLSQNGYCDGKPLWAVAVEGQWRVHTTTIWEKLLDVPAERRNTPASKTLAGCMRSLGWTGPSNLKIKKQQGNGYYKPLEGAK